MASNVHIDQVMIRKVGGWNMVTLDWWLGQSDAEQTSLISQDGVHFFADGEMLDTAATLKELGGAAAAAVPEPARPEPTVVSWPPATGVPALCTYSRMVVAGPRWEVLRADDGAAPVPFQQFMGRDEFEPYDLDTPLGARNLGNDMLGDAFGVGREPAELLGYPAIDHFADKVFNTKLGNRAWQITNRQLRALMEDNPFVRFEAAASV